MKSSRMIVFSVSRSVLNDLREQGKVECLGKGRWAKWRRIL